MVGRGSATPPPYLAPAYLPPPYVRPQQRPPPYMPPPYMPPPPPVYTAPAYAAPPYAPPYVAAHLDLVDERLSRLHLLHAGDAGSWRRPPDSHSTRITTFVATLPRPASRHRARHGLRQEVGVDEAVQVQVHAPPGSGRATWDARPGPHTFSTFASPSPPPASTSAGWDREHRF